ncbi:hypothetical protein ACH5RR_015867 [Cinchona calisaya]|uniref:Uncharacterized protein n=1 Tax=Cinchona calisaya TaxID=153742 RepID=A0ABD2ZUQ4_9GENT
MRKLKCRETKEDLLQEALVLGMSASTQVQFAQIKSQYPLDSSSESESETDEDEILEHNLEDEDQAIHEDQTNQVEEPHQDTQRDSTQVAHEDQAQDANDQTTHDDDDDIDDTLVYIMQQGESNIASSELQKTPNQEHAAQESEESEHDISLIHKFTLKSAKERINSRSIVITLFRI